MKAISSGLCIVKIKKRQTWFLAGRSNKLNATNHIVIAITVFKIIKYFLLYNLPGTDLGGQTVNVVVHLTILYIFMLRFMYSFAS